jgi:hypothetical protein
LKWITALDLQHWADRLGARAEFPGLIADLIRASASDIGDIRFPRGDKGQLRGFDGWLDAAGAPPYVPSGLSIWEFGVSDDPKSKCQVDYDKRVKKILAADRAKMTFVFASPRPWDNPRLKLPDLVKELRDKKDFADVRYIDGVQIEAWLGDCSAVAAQYARSLGKVPQTGARDVNEFWDEYSRRFRPAITEDVVLCARDGQAREIVTHLLGKPGSLVYVGDGPDEVTAVAIAAIRKAEPDSRAFLEARTLVIDTADAGRSLAVAGSYGFVVSPGANKISGHLSGYGPTVSGHGFDAVAQKYPRLDRPSTQAMTVALQTMGLSEAKASVLAVRSGRSLTILERYAPAAAFDAPEWMKDGANLIPALLAGGWDSRNKNDQAILAELGGANYCMSKQSFASSLIATMRLSIARAAFGSCGRRSTLLLTSRASSALSIWCCSKASSPKCLLARRRPRRARSGSVSLPRPSAHGCAMALPTCCSCYRFCMPKSVSIPAVRIQVPLSIA